MSEIEIYLLDDDNNTQAEINMKKPPTYQKFLEQLKQNIKNLPKFYEIFFLDKNNKEIKINNQEKYQIIEDILFIRKLNEEDNDILGQSIFEFNYNKLSGPEKENLDEKYNCKICSFIIKNENPYLCYKCQNIFHEKCLKEWDKRCKDLNKNLQCPTCRNELEIEIWNKKLDYEENRQDDANLMNKINELKDNEKEQIKLIKQFKKYKDKTIVIFKKILFKINSIHKLLKLEYNNELINLMKKNPIYFDNDDMNKISNIILEELELIQTNLEEYDEINVNGNKNPIINYKMKNRLKSINNNLSNNNNNIFKNEIKNVININNYIDIKKDNNMNNINMEQIEKRCKELKVNSEYKNTINLIYCVNLAGNHKILGKKFVENNKDNIEIFINGKPKNLSNYNNHLERGNNTITLIIKNNLKNLSYMFYMCEFLKDIDELKNLDVNESNNFSYMFYGCSSLFDINSLSNWDVSNSNTIFAG